jgi:hypothetical protein
VHSVRAPRWLVLISAGPVGDGRGAAGAEQPVVTWQWALQPLDDGRRTRLLVRQRLRRPRTQRLLWRLVEPVGFVMERRTLRGIKERAERR